MVIKEKNGHADSHDKGPQPYSHIILWMSVAVAVLYVIGLLFPFDRKMYCMSLVGFNMIVLFVSAISTASSQGNGWDIGIPCLNTSYGQGKLVDHWYSCHFNRR